MAYKKQLIGGMPAALNGLFTQFGFDILRGEGKLIDAHTIEFAGARKTNQGQDNDSDSPPSFDAVKC